MIRTITTSELAEHCGVSPSTIRRAHCLNGHYCGIKPIKLPNRFLLWNLESVEQLFNEPAEASEG